MTGEEILQLEAGPQLNASIAENIFDYDVIWINTKIGFYPFLLDKSAQTGGQVIPSLIGGSWIRGLTQTGEEVEVLGRAVPAYSEDIANAWEVEDEMNHKGWKIHLHRLADGYNCYFHHFSKMKTTSSGFSKHVPIAICKGALMAKFEIVARFDEEANPEGF
jgi:hypothetical protein